MSFYLPNPDVHPTGVEPAEFLDVPPMSEAEAQPWVPDPEGDEPTETAGGPAIDRRRRSSSRPTRDGTRVRFESRVSGDEA